MYLDAEVHCEDLLLDLIERDCEALFSRERLEEIAPHGIAHVAELLTEHLHLSVVTHPYVVTDISHWGIDI